MSDNQNTTFVERVATAGQALFEDPFSDLTRKQQQALLFSSSVTILLSIGILTLEKANIGGMSLIPQKAEYIPWVVALISMYYAIVFIIRSIQDWQSYKFKILTGLWDLVKQGEADLANMFKLYKRSRDLLDDMFKKIEDVYELDKKSQIEKQKFLEELDRIKGKNEEVDKKLKEQLDKLNTMFQKGFDELGEAGFDELGEVEQSRSDSISLIIQEQDLLFEEQEKISSRIENLDKDFYEQLEPYYEEIRQLEQEMELLSSGANAYKHRADFLRSLVQRHHRMNRLTMVFDVVFPLIVFAIAIVLTYSFLVSGT